MLFSTMISLFPGSTEGPWVAPQPPGTTPLIVDPPLGCVDDLNEDHAALELGFIFGDLLLGLSTVDCARENLGAMTQ
jgi:hypothetical protein